MKSANTAGFQKRDLLRELPDRMEEFLPATTVATTQAIWRNLGEMFAILNERVSYDEDSIPRYRHCSATQLNIVGMRPPPMPSCAACSITRGVGVDMAVSTSHPTSTSLSPTCRRSWPTWG